MRLGLQRLHTLQHMPVPETCNQLASLQLRGSRALRLPGTSSGVQPGVQHIMLDWTRIRHR